MLDLSGTEIDDAGLVHIDGLSNLQELYISETKVTDRGLVNLRGLPKLWKLVAEKTGVTEAGCRELQHALPDLSAFFSPR